MRKLAIFAAAFVLTLGLAQCKKEQPSTPQDTDANLVHITVNVGNGSRADIADPSNSGHYTFKIGDKLYVGYANACVGYLEYGSGAFSGNLSLTEAEEAQKLHFYYLGGKAATQGESQQYTVDIIDQTSDYPVISYGTSTQNYSANESSYTTTLLNKCALVKFASTNEIPVGTAVVVSGLNNKVEVNFNGNTLSYSQTNNGSITLHTENATSRWAILLPQTGLSDVKANAEGYDEAAVSFGNVSSINENDYLTESASFTMTEAISTVIDLATVTGDITLENGTILTGTLDGFDNAYKPVKISIADGATVTLNGVTINGVESYSYWDDWEWEWVHYYYYWAGLTCLGDATIILEGENTVTGFYGDYPGIQAGPTGTTLTIKGTGSLTASNHGTGAGIGGGLHMACGDIEIQGGDITANGGWNGSGIGGGNEASCGDITISGGTVTATCGDGGAGIGGGRQGSCGNISITGGTVTATCGNYAPGIGSAYGNNASCGNISIAGGTVEATGGMNAAGIGSGYYQSSCGDITIYATVTSVKATKGSGAPYSIGAGKNATSCGTVTIGGNETGNISDSPYYYPSQP